MPYQNSRSQEEDHGLVSPIHGRLCCATNQIWYHRSEVRLAGKEIDVKKSQDDISLSRWYYATWVNRLVETHAWPSAARLQVSYGYQKPLLQVKAVISGEQQGKTESMPTINPFEH